MKKFYFDYSKIKILNPNLDSVVRKFQKNCKNLVKKLRKPHVKGNPFLLQYLFVKTQFLFTVTREIKKFYFHFSKIKILDLNLDSSVQKSKKNCQNLVKKLSKTSRLGTFDFATISTMLVFLRRTAFFSILFIK